MKGKAGGIRENEQEERRAEDARVHVMSWRVLRQAHLNIDLFAQGLQLCNITGLA